MSGTKRNFMERFIGGVERIGNKLPHPFWIFTFLILFVVALSAVLATADFSVTYLAASKDPSVAPAMKTVVVKSLLSLETLNKYFGSFAGIYGGFYPIGIVLIMMMAIGLAEKSGFLTAMMRKMILGAPVQWIVAIIAFVGINSNLASDAGVVFTPLVAAAMLKSIGMNPWVGIIAGYAAANGGYTANFFIAGTDALLAGITESICIGNNISYPISPLMNWYFLIAGTVVLTTCTVIVSKYFLIPYLGGSATDTDTSELLQHQLTEDEKSGLRAAGIGALIFILALVAMALPSTSFLRNADGGFVPRSPLLSNVVALLFFFFCTIGISFGYAAKTIKSINDIPGMMQDALKGILSFLVVALPAAFFIELFNESQLPTVLAVKGAELLKAADITGIPLFLLFILICTVVNIFITSGTAKWLILGPVFVPMLAMVNISPAMTQLIYRIGDTCTNIISPIDYYVPVILGMLEAYRPKEDQKVGVGTLISLCIPFSIAYMIGFIILLVIWYVLNLPLGPGAGIYM
ncbi:MAG: AbgT family transporter [Cloacibacillus sp.]